MKVPLTTKAAGQILLNTSTGLLASKRIESMPTPSQFAAEERLPKFKISLLEL